MPDGTPDDLEFDAFATSLDEMLERVSSATRAEQEARDKEWPAPTKRMPSPRVVAASIPSSAPARAAEATTTRGSPRPLTACVVSAKPPDRGRLAWGVVALITVGAVFAWMGLRPDAVPAMPLALDQLPPPAAGFVRPPDTGRAPLTASPDLAIKVAAPWPAIASDPDASTETLMLQQLRQGIAENASVRAPTFAITRYDSLPASSGGWDVLVPFGVEEVYALVPVASRLRSLDDLRGRRINVGAPASPRAKSAEALYRTLFGHPLPPAPLRAASKDVALKALLRGDGLDALLLFDGQPSSWLSALPVEIRLQLKLLRFDPTRPSGQRAMRYWLATSVTSALATESAPVPTLGEVTFLIAARGQPASPELVHRLCERLPALRAGGHPQWKDVEPALQLPVQLSRPPDIASAAKACTTSRSSSPPASGALS